MRSEFQIIIGVFLAIIGSEQIQRSLIPEIGNSMHFTLSPAFWGIALMMAGVLLAVFGFLRYRKEQRAVDDEE